MSANGPVLQISQDMEITQPEKQNAFPITVREWTQLKQSISSLDDSNSFFHTAGSALIGAGLSTFITVVVTVFPKEQEAQRITMWAATVLCLICGALCLYFASRERSLLKRTASQVVSQMEGIEEHRSPKRT